MAKRAGLKGLSNGDQDGNGSGQLIKSMTQAGSSTNGEGTGASVEETHAARALAVLQLLLKPTLPTNIEYHPPPKINLPAEDTLYIRGAHLIVGLGG